MASLEPIPIRAKISFPDDGFWVETPYIISFNVSKTRNSVSSFSASIKIKGDTVNSFTSNSVIIEAGELDDMKKIFTGFILQATPSPCWEDPTYVVLNISGSDIRYVFQEEKFTRRQLSRFNKWALITGVTQKAIKGAQFMLANKQTLNPTENFNSPEETKGRDKPPVDAGSIPQHTATNNEPSIDIRVATVAE